MLLKMEIYLANEKLFSNDSNSGFTVLHL